MSVTGAIGGNSFDGYVRESRRVQQLCNPMQVLTLTLSTNYPNSITPAQSVVLYENGTKCFTGYVIKVTRERPSYDWKIEAHDSYTRCINYFIDETLTVGHDANDQPIPGYVPQSTNYWIGYLCDLAGVSYTSSGGTGTVPQGVQIGLRTVHESLQDIIAYSSQYVRVNADGELRFERISRNLANKTLTSSIEVEDETSDEDTRNIVKIFGYSDGQNRIFSSQSVSIPGLGGDAITAVASPMISTQAEATRIGQYLLSELGALTRIVTAKVDGDPSIHIGQAARIVYDVTDVTDAITTVTHTTDEKGYVTEVTIGERCPRIAGWSRVSPPIYAGTTVSGVYRSLDSGVNWEAFNTGLPAGNKYVRRIGVNPDQDAMAIVNGSLYYTDGTNPWAIRSLPSPTNSAGDSPAPNYGTIRAVTAGQILGKFFVMTVNPRTSGSAQQNARTWLYESSGSGALSWTSTEMYDSTPTTGSGYHFIGLDLSSELGAPYITGSSGSIYADLNFYKGDMGRSGYRNTFGVNDCADIDGLGITDFYLKTWSVTGAGTSQVLHVTLGISSNFAPGSEFLYYKVFDNASDFWLIDNGPWPTSGLNIVNFTGDQVSFTIPWQSGPFVVAIAFDSLTNSGFSTFYIRNGDPRGCADLISGDYDHFYLSCGFMEYEFA